MSQSATGPKPRLVTCPQCGIAVAWDSGNKYRPFCSERCKMIDLGAWATESYRIPVEEDNDQLDEDGPAENQPRN